MGENSIKYQSLLYMLLIVLLLYGCAAGEPQPAIPASPKSTPPPTPNWLTFQVRQITILEDRSDGGNGAELQMFVIGTDGKYAARLTYPADGFIPVSVGETIQVYPFGLSIDEKFLGNEVTFYVLAVDMDELSFATNVFIDLLISVVIKAVSGGGANPVIDIVGGTAASGLSEWIQQEDIIGQKTVRLSRANNWGVGQPTTAIADDEGFEIEYQVYLSNHPLVSSTPYSSPTEVIDEGRSGEIPTRVTIKECTLISEAYVDDTDDGNIIHVTCNDGSTYQLGPLSQGEMIVGPNDKFLIYCTNDGYLYSSRVDEQKLREYKNIRKDMPILRKEGNVDLELTFISGDNQYVLKVRELVSGSSADFLIDRRISE